MKKASELAAQSLNTPQSQTGSKKISEESSDAITQLFGRFKLRYEKNWTNRFTSRAMYDASKREWTYMLAQFSDREIMAALDQSADSYPSWPPTPGEFRALCKMQRKEPSYQPLQITNPTKPETVASEVGKMMALLK